MVGGDARGGLVVCGGMEGVMKEGFGVAVVVVAIAVIVQRRSMCAAARRRLARGLWRLGLP